MVPGTPRLFSRFLHLKRERSAGMTSTTPPRTRPENPGVEAPGDDPRREPVDKIAPPAPGVGRPAEAPVDPNRKPDEPPVDAPQKREAVAIAQENSELLPPRDIPRG
jgi:hypothetical protein